jgi:hypothetical protein
VGPGDAQSWLRQARYEMHLTGNPMPKIYVHRILRIFI